MRPSEAEVKYLEVLRGFSGEERVRIGFELYRLARRIVEASVRAQYPDASDEEVERHIRQRFAA